MEARIMTNIVIAEDDRFQAVLLREYFERYHSLVVFLTDSVGEIEGLLECSKAGLLLLDIVLRDGDITQSILHIKRKYGDAIYILVLTGQWRQHSEGKLLQDGADVILRKPQDPAVIWQQIVNLTSRGKQDLKKTLGRLFFEGGYFDLDGGEIRHKDNGTVMLSRIQKGVMLALAQAFHGSDGSDDGWVSWGDLYLAGYGCSAEALSSTSNILRKTIFRVRKVFPENAIQNVVRGRSESYYRLNPEIFLLKKMDSDLLNYLGLMLMVACICYKWEVFL